MEDGWHEVRYGRRRRRNRAPPGDWGRGRMGWKARAPSPSPRRWDQFPYPSRPAPPPLAAYFSGPQTRSYAAVTRTRPQHPRWWGDFSRDRGSEVRREAADPQFACLIRKLYKVLRMVHHLQNVAPRDDRSPPRMIGRMMDTLTGMIKPAAPSRQTMDLIEGNARNWGYTTCIILKEHYEAGLEDSLLDLVGSSTTGWKEAFQVASRWAKRNLPRITRAVVDHAEAVITTRLEGDGLPQSRAPQSGSSQPLAPQLPPPQISTPQPAVSQPLVPQAGPAQVPTTSVVEGTSSVMANVQPPVQQQPTVLKSVATNTSQGDDWTWTSLDREPPQEQRDISRSLRKDPSQQPEAGPPLQDIDPPQCQDVMTDLVPQAMVTRGPRLEESQGWANLDDQDILLVPERTASQLELEKLFDDLQAEEEREGAEILAAHSTAMEEDIARLTSGDDVVEAENVDEDEDEFERSFDYSRPRATFTVKRHKTTTNKMVDWDLEVHKKWVILGDSNLSRCPDFTQQDLQVDSFAGANFRHAESFIRRAWVRPGLVVEKVVLSFGINNRRNKPKETTIKSLQAAIRAVKSKFPYAQYWVSLINFSPGLDEVEKQNLLILNDHIHKNMPFVPLLPDRLFRTESDHVHWTTETAEAMLDHWIDGLNS